MLAPVIWMAAIIYCGTQPEFSHVSQFISELGERGSPTELIMRYAGFVPSGLMHIAFAACAYAAFTGNRLAAAGAALIAINGLARIGAGFFPCEPGCDASLGAMSQRLHGLSATIGFFALIGASIAWGIVLRKHRGLRALAVFSFVCGIAGLAFLLFMERSPEVRGLYERLSSGALSVWILVFAATLWHQRRNAE